MKALKLIGIPSMAIALSLSFVSCSDDDPQLPTSTTETEPGPVEEQDTPSGTINGYGYVDMGLSVKWATCNVGASISSDYGNYYAWGEIEPKSEYTVDNCITYNKDIGNISGNPNYDAASANWGGTWRMPTKDEVQELCDNTTVEWTTRNGLEGALFISEKNSNSIFLPGAGLHYRTLNEPGTGYYWTSTPDNSALQIAYGFVFYFSSTYNEYSFHWQNGQRFNGQSVRPVSD